MKKLRTLLYGLCAAAMVTGCSEDGLNGNDPGNSIPNLKDGDGVFMALDIEMPNGRYNQSRSQTTDDGGSTGGIEVGQDYENTVNSALIVLASKDDLGADMPEYGFIAAGEVRSNRIETIITGNDSKQYKATASIQKENLESFYGIFNENNTNTEETATAASPEVYVFVFCNPTNDLINVFGGDNILGSTTWIDATCQVTQDKTPGLEQNTGIWGANSFLMNNVSLTTRALPAKLADWVHYNNVENPFHLSDNNTECNVDNSIETRGAVKVERSVARFDFKDGSGNNNTYEVLSLANEDNTASTPIVEVKLEKMCLVNMSNLFYYLPRVSDNGQPNGTGYALLGQEKRWTRDDNGNYAGGNYAVGPYYKEFYQGVEKDFSQYFNYAFFEDEGSFNNNSATWDRWYVSNIDDVLNNGQGDNYKVTEGNTGTYKIWRYVTENLIPGPRDNQLNGISTGVVFKAHILGTEDATTGANLNEEAWNKGASQNLANCLNGKEFTYNGEKITLTGSSDHDPILYYFAGNMYMGWRHIRQAAIQASVTYPDGYDKAPVINRSNSLYKAVFGDGPIPTTLDTNNPMVYVYYEGDVKKQNTIKDELWDLYKDDENSTVYDAYLKSANYAWSQWAVGGKEVGDDATGVNTPEALAKMRAAVTDAGITIFQSSNDDATPGYYCYYYYWNRHNDNGLNGSMGPMEFDVVRNNVYKLSVDKISRLGHPRIPENDPDKPTPNTPDESDKIYIDVKVEIVPWAVRLNSIQF